MSSQGTEVAESMKEHGASSQKQGTEKSWPQSCVAAG